MAFLFSKLFPNVSRHSNAARAAAEMGNAALAYSLSRALTAAGVATATTTSQAKIVNSLQYSIAGRHFVKGATDNFWTLSGTTVLAASFQKYLLLIDGAGAASIQEGVQSIVNAASVGWTNVSALSVWAPFMVALSNTKAIAGVLTVATDATHTFIPGTTLLGAAGITATFIDGVDQSLLPLVANQQGVLIGVGS